MLANPESAAYSQLVVLRIMEAASLSVTGLSRPFKLEDYKLLLEAVGVMTRGTSKELQARIFESQVRYFSGVR